MLNTRGALDARNVLTGKDGALYNDQGVMLATIETFQAQANVTNIKYQPLGDAQEHEVFQAFGATLTFTETVIADERFIQELFQGMKKGIMPAWNFQGVIKGRNGSEQRVIYRQCVPSGTIDLQNLSVGDIIKRAWSLFINEAPELQGLLTQ